MSGRFFMFFLLLLFQLIVTAQVSDTGFSQVEETVIDSAEEDTASDDEEEVYYIDTVLLPNGNKLVYDSILALKETKSFAYAKILDSLLLDAKRKEEERMKKLTKGEVPWIVKVLTSKITQYILWAIGAFFIGFILYKLFLLQNLFKRNTKSIITDAIIDDGKENKDYKASIAKAIQVGDYRAATRYVYLDLLKRLNDKEAIVLAADKTNAEYIKEIAGKTYKQSVVEVIRFYEYVWYGEFNISSEQFFALQNKYNAISL